MIRKFMECESCSAKSGSPELCNSCYNNRLLISHLENEVPKKRKIRVSFKTTRNLFTLGFAWNNDSSNQWMIAILVGCISMEILWDKSNNQYYA